MRRPWALVCGLLLTLVSLACKAEIMPVEPRVEWRVNPLGVETSSPRLSWKVQSSQRGATQSAYRILVASTTNALNAGAGDLWDSGRVSSDETVSIPYRGRPLSSSQKCFWKVQCWDAEGHPSAWSDRAEWTMGLLSPGDWQAQWISFADRSPVHADRDRLDLPPARYYRTEFHARPRLRRAIVHASALGIYELEINGRKVGDSFFEPGWSDYLQRAYYRTHDVTELLRAGDNALGAVVAEGWYAGYVGYGLLVGYGPNRSGKNFYGKTPALRIQLELEYEDGSRERVMTDDSWKVSDEGPVREADLIMGERYDARMELRGWSSPGFPSARWTPASVATANGPAFALFSDTQGSREVNLGFQPPAVMQAYAAPSIRVTGRIPAKRIASPQPGVALFDLGQNIAGVIQLKVHGKPGERIQIRYGEMLHPDGRLMTENLRRARATDYYICRGEVGGETWTPRFTYHGFQYVELTGWSEDPALDAVLGLVLHNDTPLVGHFACSDPVMSRFWTNAVWTQRANFVEVPTDCPQRDERLGWMGDAQIYARTATYNADVAAFFTKWMEDVREAQLGVGAYPDYSPYPMSHGEPRKSFGTAWMDAGVICPWTMWRVYGDTRLIERQWESMQRFMQFRIAASSKGLGVSIGNPWGDWLNLNEETPIEYIDSCYYAHTAQLMAEMAGAIGRNLDSTNYMELRKEIGTAFAARYLDANGVPKVETQTACVLALAFDLIPTHQRGACAASLASRIANNKGRMATGFLGTKHLLPALTEAGKNDLALSLFQSREFPSWGYEVVNGATTVWERWDSFTREDGFGRHNAAMNSFSHYSFGAVCEWAFRCLAGIDAETPGYRRVVIRPNPPAAPPQGQKPSMEWVRCDYDSVRGRISSHWKWNQAGLALDIQVPANTVATVEIPANSLRSVTESERPLSRARGVRVLDPAPGRVRVEVGGGEYHFLSR